MIDGQNKAFTDRFWNGLARPLVALHLTPNQVTILGLVLVLANCGVYLRYHDPFWFGVGLALSFAFDGLDGAVARLTGTSTKFGGYLDAVIDRYQEIAVYFVISWVTGWWPISFLALSGSLLTSYNKARTAIEVPIDNTRWPDLLERMERIIIICAALILNPFIRLPFVPNGSVLFAGLLIIALFSHVTAIQRFWRGRKVIARHVSSKTEVE